MRWNRKHSTAGEQSATKASRGILPAESKINVAATAIEFKTSGVTSSSLLLLSL